ncbi:unnamed protein product [Polarella glacialis]|uniref:Vacuolar protein 14 C-terminal Fig4-binding domain-containing protein n=1 Tax=Polarella glacialis TaxID=89957 RepID=A0A813HNJ0_POLGL|nr:unnamed protein product [Polarella glacialis]
MAGEPENILGENIVQALSDKFEKRKQASLEIEAKVRDAMLLRQGGSGQVLAIIDCLRRDYIESSHGQNRKGGLIGLASVAIGLDSQVGQFLPQLLHPVLELFKDQDDARVRYYACEALYNISKVASEAVLPHFNAIFEGLCRLYADVVTDVRNGAQVLDRLMKDIVMQHASKFRAGEFVPLLSTRMHNKNPAIRQLVLAWITLLLQFPEVDMVCYLPQFLERLFDMLGDQSRDIRHNADACLNKLLCGVKACPAEKAMQIVSETAGVVVKCCFSSDNSSRLTALCWLFEFVHLPLMQSEGPAIVRWRTGWATHMPEVLGGTLHCIDDVEDEIARMAVEMNSGLLEMAQSLGDEIPVDKLVDKLVTSMRTKDSVSDSMVVHTACLQWICMLLAQSPKKMLQRRTLQRLFTPIFESLVHPDDEVVVASLRVLAQIMEGAAIGGSEQELFDEEFFDDGGEGGGAAASAPSSSSAAGRPAWNVPSSSPSAGAAVVSPSDSRGGSDLFTMVVHRLLKLFASKTQMLETRGRLMIRQLCGHLDPRRLYVTVAQAIQQEPDLVFAQQLVQTFSWILLTAAETRGLREELLQEAQHPQLLALAGLRRPLDEASAVKESVTSDIPLFLELLEPWFHNPVSALALCLWSQQYELASELTARFAAFEPTLDLLRQLDQLVHLIESPVFSRLRLRLLEPRRHPALIKCLLGLAMLLPQAGAFNILRERITVVQSGLLLEAQRDDAPDRSEAVPASSTWWSGSGRPAPSQPAKDIRQIDVRGWIQRFDQVSSEYQC